jgi:hypothetical protein
MPFPTCNPWISNTVRFSDQQAACLERSGRAMEYELLDPNFLLAVLDSLQRLAAKGTEGFRQLSDYTACDGEANAHNAQCAIQPLSPPMQFNDTEIKQIILWQLGNALCTLNA